MARSSVHPPVSMIQTIPDFPPETFEARRRRILERLGDGAMVLPAAEVVHSSRDTEYPYRPDSELFYVTGVRTPGVVAVLRAHADDERFVLFVRSRDDKAELWHGARPEPAEVGERVGADATYPLERLEELLPDLLAGAERVHFRLDAEARCDALIRRALRTARFKGPRKGDGPRGVLDPGGILDEMRLRKDPGEIARIRRAVEITEEGFREAMSRIRPGAGEWEIEAALEGTFRALGADGPAYGTIVGSGPNACVLHYVDNHRVMGSDELLLVDAGASFGLYGADLTRTLPTGGCFTPDQRVVYDIVEAAREAAVSVVGPGRTTSEVHAAAVRVLVEGLVDLELLEGDPRELAEAGAHEAFFPHRTSHWLGLDVHDPGDYARGGESRILEPGMVLTVEPGLYFGPDAKGVSGRFHGLGVRIEDDVLVTSESREVLTSGIPTAPDQLSPLIDPRDGE